MAKYVYEVHVDDTTVQVEADDDDLDKDGNLGLYVKPGNVSQLVAQFASGVWQYWQRHEKGER